MIEVIEKESVEAGIKNYRDLRKNYYGTDAYDFSEDALNQLGRTLASKSKISDAIAVMKLKRRILSGIRSRAFHPWRIVLQGGREAAGIGTL